MTKEESLKVISQLSTVIGTLERKWPHPRKPMEVASIQTLLEIRETVRKAMVREGQLIVSESSESYEHAYYAPEHPTNA